MRDATPLSQLVGAAHSALAALNAAHEYAKDLEQKLAKHGEVVVVENDPTEPGQMPDPVVDQLGLALAFYAGQSTREALETEVRHAYAAVAEARIALVTFYNGPDHGDGRLEREAHRKVGHAEYVASIAQGKLAALLEGYKVEA